jgi:Ca2+-binding EF-hand superfamily protein
MLMLVAALRRVSLPLTDPHITLHYTRTYAHSLQATRGLSADESDRLMAALDTEGDGKLAYRELLAFVLQRMGFWATRLPDLAADLAWQLAEAAGGALSATENLRRRLDIADSSQEGRLPPAVLGRCLRSVGLGLSEQQLSELVSVLDAHGDGRVPYAALLEFCEGQCSGGQRRGSTSANSSSTSAQHRLESALRDAVWRAAGPHTGSSSATSSSASSGSVTALRRVFDRYLDTDGDGFITVQDLGAALPELGVTRLGTSAQELSALLCAMDSRHRSLGQISFKDFSDFMRGSSTNSSSEPMYSTAGAADRSAEARRQARLGSAAAASGSGGAARRQSISAHSVALAPQLRDLKKVLGLTGGAKSVTAAAARRALLVYDPSRSGRLPFSK